MNTSDDQHLETFIRAALKDLPPRAAPASLEKRVLAAIDARRVQPWWQKSFSYWPTPLRFFFLAATAGLGAATIWGLIRAFGAVPVIAIGDGLSLPSVGWHQTQAAFQSLIALLVPLLPNDLTLWLYAGLGVVVSFYAILLAAGAVAYRTLWRAP